MSLTIQSIEELNKLTTDELRELNIRRSYYAMAQYYDDQSRIELGEYALSAIGNIAREVMADNGKRYLDEKVKARIGRSKQVKLIKK